METLNLGDKVTVKVKYVRTTDNDERYWDVIQIKETTGIFVGYRMLIATHFISENDTTFDGELVENSYWINKPQCKCALVAINKKQIIKVPLNAL
jgi:hypothetical protein